MHIQKCGGMKIRKSLADAIIQSKNVNKENAYIPEHFGLSPYNVLINRNESDIENLSKKNLKVIADHSSYYSDEIKSLKLAKEVFYFTILRHPVQRILSTYNYFYYNEFFNYDNCQGIKIHDLPEKKLNNFLRKNSEYFVKYLAGKNWNIEKEVTSQDYKMACDNLLKMDFIGIQEFMPESMDILDVIIPQWLPINNNHKDYVNKGGNKSYNDIDEYLIDKIEKANYFDLKLYKQALVIFHKKYFDFLPNQSKEKIGKYLNQLSI